MSIDRDCGEIQFTCDGYDRDNTASDGRRACTATLETGETEWIDAKYMLDSKGWKTRKRGSEWLHFCDSCSAMVI